MTINDTFRDNNRNICALPGQSQFIEIHKCSSLKIRSKIPGHRKIVQDGTSTVIYHIDGTLIYPQYLHTVHRGYNKCTTQSSVDIMNVHWI